LGLNTMETASMMVPISEPGPAVVAMYMTGLPQRRE
jgi:hypothetical protein